MNDASLTGNSNAVAVRMESAAAATLAAMLLGWWWSFYPFNDLLSAQGTPLGADFAMFYTAGRLFWEGGADQLYNQAEHQRRLLELFPGISPDFCLPYRYPPFVAAAMAPLAALPYAASYAVFAALSVACGFAAAQRLSRDLRILQGPWRRPILSLAAAWPVALENVLGGQAAMLALLIAAGTVACLDKRRWLLAGCVLGLAAYKPNVLLLFAAGLIAWQPKLLAGAALSGAALAILSLACAGSRVCGDWLELSLRLTAGPWDLETPFWKVHSLASWFALAVPGAGRMLALSAGAVAAVAVGRWMRRHAVDAPQRLAALSLLITINALGNPYTPIYDLLLLAAGGVWLAESFYSKADRARGDIGCTAAFAIGLLFLGPHISQAIAKMCGMQLFPLALAACAIGQAWRLTPGAGQAKDYFGFSSAFRSDSST
ncbi:MAG: DUF2029 domain-containing protein [Planctomycetes bacterium]|nr:DUF2029 domain-containing protein [Planctomycetota bacterium]